MVLEEKGTEANPQFVMYKTAPERNRNEIFEDKKSIPNRDILAA
jgi:hypothetical protein